MGDQHLVLSGHMLTKGKQKSGVVATSSGQRPLRACPEGTRIYITGYGVPPGGSKNLVHLSNVLKLFCRVLKSKSWRIIPSTSTPLSKKPNLSFKENRHLISNEIRAHPSVLHKSKGLSQK